MPYYEDKLKSKQKRDFFWKKEPKKRSFSWQQEPNDQRNFSWQHEPKQTFGWESEKGSFYDWGLSDRNAF
jgi:type II secretory pathway component PulJ